MLIFVQLTAKIELLKKLVMVMTLIMAVKLNKSVNGVECSCQI